jgi:hypothetical protein
MPDNVRNILGDNSADNQYVSSSVAANADGSMIERMEYIQQNMNGTGVRYNAPNYDSVSITFAALTTGSVATHEILTVTGLVRLRIAAVCIVNVAGSGSIQLGVEGVTNALIAATTGTDLDAGEIWDDATPTTAYDTFTNVVFDSVINGLDVGYEITTDTLTGGNITFYYWWEPLNSTGAVVAADGTGTL